jgi:hypothetical protein
MNLYEDDAIFLIGCIDELDPEHESEAWRFATQSVLPTCTMLEDCDLAYEMLEELEVMLTFLDELVRL